MESTKTINIKKRIGYIDSLRGFTMILVVFAHVELFSFGIYSKDSLIGSIFISFRMPMFFFISGYIAYKLTNWNFSYYRQMLKKKAIVQLIPTLFFFFLFSICQGKSFFSLFSDGPQGFWFTIVLFYMFVLYFTTMLICHSCKSWVSDAVLLVLSIIGAFTYIGGMKFYNLESLPILCLTNLSRYFEFFVFGNLCRKYNSKFLSFISNETVKIFLFLLFLFIFIIDWNESIIRFSYIHIFNHEFTLRFIGLLFVFSLFHNYKDYFDSESPIAHSLRFIGKRTLDIYLIHFFLIPDLGYCKYVILGNITPQNTLVEFLMVFLITITIILFCLLLSAIIRSSSFLGHYLLGAKLITKE